MTSNDTQALHKRKEDVYQKLAETGKEIASRINELKTRREQRNTLTATAREHKVLRKDLSKVIKEKIAEVKTLRAKLPDKPSAPLTTTDRRGREERVTPGKLREEIQRIETKLETSAMAFTEEQKLTKVLKEKKAILSKLGGESDLERDVRARSKDIDRLKKESDVAHEVVTRAAKESQEHHETILKLSKEIEDLKKTEAALREEYTAIRAQLQENVEIPDLPSKKPRKTKTQPAGPSAEDKQTLQVKAAEVEQKVKDKKKLTTEDLLAFQAHK